MNKQWRILFVLILVLIIALLSVANVDPVSVNYLFGMVDLPLIVVIIGSLLIGALLVGIISSLRIIQLQKKIRQLKNRSYLSQDKTDEPVEDQED
ncbi:LapA family protein [Terrilactibacillus laevilacticus]|uniref:Lipopolysaccharide assembly LapA domain-containing protein n=1 Tax=Terrilactibacillus laevilacticus TaxID=1380157 RepID=A0ABW5PTC1_9BACI|nr:LapA family protein [Terrilactibacillus laevilacticus]